MVDNYFFFVNSHLITKNKVYATLDEHSKNLGEFGEKYEKDSLKILSNIPAKFPLHHPL